MSVKTIFDDLRKKYIESGGNTCPFCGSTELDSGPINVDGTLGTNNVRCDTCKQEWTDEYTVTLVHVNFECEL